MDTVNLGYSIPYEKTRHEEIEIMLGIFEGYAGTDCLRLMQVEIIPPISERQTKEIGKVIIPIHSLCFVTAKFIEVMTELKDTRHIKFMPEQRVKWLEKSMHDFLALNLSGK